MKFKVETMTPDKARKLLQASEHFANRTIIRRRVERLVHAIETGQWIVTHQPVAVTTQGVLLDGQHRLTAIAEAGIPVEIMVARDVDPSTFGVIDTGAVRTIGDALKIAGYTATNHRAAIVRTRLTYDAVVGSSARDWSRHHAEVTTKDVLDYLEEHNDAVDAALHTSRRVAMGLSRYGLISSIGAVGLILDTTPTDIGTDTRAEFFERLNDGVLLGPMSPILALRRWYTSDTGYVRVPGQYRRQTSIAVTIKAINDYALDRDRSVIVWRHGSEPMPAPLPPGAIEEASIAHENELAAREAEAG